MELVTFLLVSLMSMNVTQSFYYYILFTVAVTHEVPFPLSIALLWLVFNRVSLLRFLLTLELTFSQGSLLLSIWPHSLTLMKAVDRYHA